MSADIDRFSTLLARFVPLVEPTAIDEYRIDVNRLAPIQPEDAITAMQLKHAILPPLTPRWQRSSHNLQGGGLYSEYGERDGLLQVPPEYFARVRFDMDMIKDQLRNGFYKTAVQLLEKEIARQINVRDHVLAEQADMIVAYRPFVHRTTPTPTSGVKEEIATITRIARLNDGTRRPLVIIFHPPRDEERRRTNLVALVWPKVRKLFSDLGLSEEAPIRSEIISAVKETAADPHTEALRERIADILTSRVGSLGEAIFSSMPPGNLTQEDVGITNFIDELFDMLNLNKPLPQQLADDLTSDEVDCVLIEATDELTPAGAQEIRSLLYTNHKEI